MAQNVFSPDAWTRARNRFVEDLTVEEQRVFSQASPEAILYEASAADKTHQATSTTRGLVAKLQPFVEAVEQYGTALDVYSNIYPLVMGPLWGSVRVVLHLAQESRKYFEKIADMFNHISNLLPRLRVYEQLFTNHERLVQSLSVIYFDVLNFCTDAKTMFRRSKLAMLTLIWKPFARQFGSHMDALRRHQEELEKEVLLSHMIEAADSRAVLRSNQAELAKERYDKERLSIFASLSFAVDYEAKHRNLRGLRHEGTGMWLIEHPAYVAWKASASSEGFLLYGIPGSGKSVLTSLIVDDHLQAPNSPTKNSLYFYCDYANPPTLQPAHIYRALLQQLFFKGLMTEAAVKTVVETLSVNTNGLNEQMLTNMLCDAIQSCLGMHIILDGLDECERDVQQTVTNTLHRLLRYENLLIKILVTCRDEGHLLTKLSTFGRLEISRHASAADIGSYISHAVASSLSSGDLTLRNPALEEEIVSKLLSKAQGMFLWVHFQINDLCDAASDEDIREVLGHLPEGLYDTYSRIFKKIEKKGVKATVLRIMMWMVCARRPLRVEELQEAVAFNEYDKCWDAEKIPDGDKIIKSCHGLVVRDSENQHVRLAHHTVQQYLTSPRESLLPADFGENMPIVHSWPELYSFICDSNGAEIMAGKLCATYLCFSDFETALSRIQDDRKLDVAAAFKGRGPISIPAALGLRKHLHTLPYKYFGSNNNFKMPDIDYSKYLNVMPRDRRPSPDFRKKFALLEYVIEYWPWHTRWLQWEVAPSTRFWHLVQYGSLAFEFRPWGANQHFGPKGCKGCPVPESGDLESKDLPSMALVHWAAETGHLKVFDIVEPRLQEYLKHERYHDETLLIACRHGQVDVVELLLARRAFDLSDGRAIVAACASGYPSILKRLLQAQEARSDRTHKLDFSSTSDFSKIGSIALYHAASTGDEDLVEFLLARKAAAYVSDTTTGLTPLQIAAKHGHLEVVKALEGRSMDPAHEKTCMKALHYAAINGHDETVTFLLKHGSGSDDFDSLGETALIKASKTGRAMVAKALLEGGADPHVRGGKLSLLGHRNPFIEFSEGEWHEKPMAIHHAASSGHDNVLAILPYSKAICEPNKTNALHIAAAYGHPKAVQALLLKGANIERKDIKGMTALHYASYNGHILVVQLLLDTGCSVDGRARSSYTALHFAAQAAQIEVVKLLVARGAAVNAEVLELYYQRGETALHIAAQNANPDTIRALVECGVPVEERRSNGWTALDVALFHDKRENLLALIELGAEWIREEVFQDAIGIRDKYFQRRRSEVVEVLLSKLSTATTERQNDAAAIIRKTLERSGSSGNEEAKRMLKEWLEGDSRTK